jgi:hypothetical protein
MNEVGRRPEATPFGHRHKSLQLLQIEIDA